MRIARCALATIALLTACTTTGHSSLVQLHSGVVAVTVDTVAECRNAERLLAWDGPAPGMARPLWRARACPHGAALILSALLDSLRTTDDTSSLQRATWLTQYVRDGRVLQTALSIARDPAAASGARVAAWRVLIWAKAPGHLLPLHRVGSGEFPCSLVGRCWSTYTGHFYGGGPMAGDTLSWPVVARPMPVDHLSQIDRVAAEVAGDARAPVVVQNAARLALATRPDTQVSDR